MSYSWLLLLPGALLAWTHLLAVVGFAVQAADRNEPIEAAPRVLARVSREAMVRAALILLGWCAWGRPAPRFAGTEGRKAVPVLLVGGMSFNRASLWALRLYLVRRGFGWVHAIDRQDRRGTLATEAEGLAAGIGQLRAASGAAQVDVVAFSTGGLVAAWYLRHHGPHAVRRLVTIGTGWKGTRLAVFGRGRAVEEMRYGSHVLDGLWPPPVPTACVFSTDDPVIVPAASAIPAHHADAVQVDDAGHVEMLMSARVFRAVLAALERPLPESSASRPEDSESQPAAAPEPAAAPAGDAA